MKALRQKKELLSSQTICLIPKSGEETKRSIKGERYDSKLFLPLFIFIFGCVFVFGAAQEAKAVSCDRLFWAESIVNSETCCIDFTIRNPLPYDCYSFGPVCIRINGVTVDTLAGLDSGQAYTFSYCPSPDEVVNWTLELPGVDPNNGQFTGYWVHLQSGKVFAEEIEKCRNEENCPCPEDKSDWITFDSQYGDKICGSGKCMITPILNIPEEIVKGDCYRYYSYCVTFRDVLGNIWSSCSSRTIGEPVGSYCVNSGETMDVEVKLAKRTGDTCILRATSKPCEKPRPEADCFYNDCEKRPDGSEQWHKTTKSMYLDDYPDCWITYTYEYRICNNEYQMRGAKISFWNTSGCQDLVNYLFANGIEAPPI